MIQYNRPNRKEMSAKILIVDDDPSACQTLEDLLMGENYALQFTRNGADGLEQARKWQPDLILSDIMMPGMDGYEFCRMIREDKNLEQVPVILITALGDRQSKLKGLQSGADDFLTKPFDSVELRARLRTITRLDRFRKLHEERTKLEETDRKLQKVNEELILSEARFHQMFKNHSAIMLLIEPETGAILEMNVAARNFYGYTADQWENMKIQDINILPGGEADLKDTPDKPGNSGYTVSSHRLANGEIRLVEEHSSPITAQGKTILFSIILDVTQRNEAEQALIEAKEKAEESDRLKSAFLTNMSHEIRTPMNGILGFTDLLRTSNLSEADRAEYIDIIKLSGNRMLSTINDLIEISSIETGVVSVTESETNINDVVHFLYSFFDLQSRQKGLRLECHTPLPDDQAVVITDKSKLDSILINLIRNAIKFTYGGSVIFGYEALDQELEFYVTDTGIGIPADKLDSVFERFVQADLRLTRPYEGSGLGLSISKAYVAMLGGNIWVESRQNIGSTFRFTIPRKTTERTCPEILSTPAHHPSNPLKNSIILIAEDDDINYTYMKKILFPLCKSVLRACDGKEVIDQFKANPGIGIIFMDIKMPEMDGYEATRIIREFDKEVLIIAQTAYAFKREQEKALEAGCNDYISKPFDAGTLLDKINQHYKPQAG